VLVQILEEAHFQDKDQAKFLKSEINLLYRKKIVIRIFRRKRSRKHLRLILRLR